MTITNLDTVDHRAADSRPDVVYVPMSDGLPHEWQLLWRTAAETTRIRAFCQAAADFVKANGYPLQN